MFDDLPTILNNHEIRYTTAKKLFFSNVRWISKLINLVTLENWKLNPLAYRIVNLGIHIFSGILLFILILVIFKNVKTKLFLKKNALLLATIVSGLFLLHPVQTQTATYITQIRLEGLVALFSFSTIILFALATYTNVIWKKTFLYLSCAVLVVFGAGAKEIIVVLPILLMLVDWFFLAEGDYKIFLKRLPIHLSLAGILYYTYLKMGSPIKPAEAFTLKVKMRNNRGNALTTKPQEYITPIKYLIGQFRVVLHYITMFFWPTGLSFDYGWKIPASFWSPASLFPFIALMSILLSGLVLFIRNQINLVSFCIAWFFTVVTPRSSIIPSTEMVCDYKTYIASVGPLLFIALGVTYLVTRIKINKFVMPAVLLLTLGFVSMQRNKVWASRLHFWGDVIKKTEPHVPARAYNNYAVGLVNKGNQDEAIQCLLKAIKTDETYAEPVINLALQYQIKLDYSKALQHYRHAMTLKEVHPEMYNNLGLLHLKRKDYSKAEKSFKTALKLKKYYTKALFNLGQTYQQQKKLKEALKYYELSTKGNHPTINCYYTAGFMAYSLNKHRTTIKYLEYVERNSKNYRKTRPMLANSYYATKQYAKSLPIFKNQYFRNPDNSSTCYNYAQNLLQLKEYDRALPLFQKSLGSKKFIHAPLHTIKCLHYTGRTELAKQKLAQFLKTTPIPVLKQMGANLMKEIS
jgi:tetratricopeptide (TPR) repeat protein